jgi:hypothetical protein
LLLLAEQLLDPEEREELHQMIFDVEKRVLETAMEPKELEDGTVLWVEKVRGKLSLYDVEMALESNPDYYAYFELEDGTKVTKFDVERELNKIKSWLYQRVRERSIGKRFARFR